VLYTVTAVDSTNPSGTRSSVGTQSPIQVSGLTSGDAYEFVVTATRPANYAAASGVAATNGAHLRIIFQSNPYYDIASGIPVVTFQYQGGDLTASLYGPTDFDLPPGAAPAFTGFSAAKGVPGDNFTNWFQTMTATGACTGVYPEITCDPLVIGLNAVTLSFS
jgi:hypothetical protein